MADAFDFSMLASAIAAFLFGYVLGSIPFGVLLTRLGHTRDIRAIGSGNIGATNVLRTGRKGLAAATLAGDILKGTAAVLIVLALTRREIALVAALGAFVGHLVPIWLRFKGGKGVATYIGVLLALAWPAAVAFCLIWLAIAVATRYSSLAALVASAAVPVVLWLTHAILEAQLFLLLTVVLWLRHRDNIARLVNGTEGKIGQHAQAAPDA
jgi:glycerol-3-phosphate acyltransferase PlsY